MVEGGKRRWREVMDGFTYCPIKDGVGKGGWVEWSGANGQMRRGWLYLSRGYSFSSGFYLWIHSTAVAGGVGHQKISGFRFWFPVYGMHNCLRLLCLEERRIETGFSSPTKVLA